MNRKEFVSGNSRAAAVRQCPWAAIIAKCEGGFYAFENMVDFKIWKEAK